MNQPDANGTADASANLASAADQFAQYATGNKWGRLDFTYVSLYEIDGILTRAINKVDGDTGKRIVVDSMVYVGEVLIRVYGCCRGVEGNLNMLAAPPYAAAGSSPVDVTDIVWNKLTRNLSVAEQVLSLAKAWFNAPLSQPDPNDLPAVMRSYAESFVRAAKAAGNLWLDYSPESVIRLDEFISQGWPVHPPKGTYEDMIPTIGAYVGTILVQQTGAHWIKDPAEGYGVELRGIAWPMSPVAKRFEKGPEHSIGRFYREVSSHWLSGNEEVPATWKVTAEPEKRDGLFGWHRGH